MKDEEQDGLIAKGDYQSQQNEINGDEENCLISKSSKTQENVKPIRASLVKKLNLKNYFSLKIQKMKRPEILLIVIALLLTLVWFEIICLVKHDHDQMKQKQLIQLSQKTIIGSSFIEIPHGKTPQQDVLESEESNDLLKGVQVKKKEKMSKKKAKDNKQNKPKNDDVDFEQLKMITPLNDENKYKFVKLENGLKVLLISDLDTPHSYASLDVRIGSWNEHIPGLAHFLEHMKFIATNEFASEPNAFDNFLTTNQGSNNAYTQSDHTNYHYTVSPIALKESLKYFSYMFNKSQFDREFVMKEINAVNSEFVNTLTNDNWKIQYLFNILAKKDHPAHQFTCGSNETLISDKFDILKELDDFDKQNYSSNLMSLVIYSNQSIEELESFVEYAEFNKIPNLNKEDPSYLGFSIKEEEQGSIYKIKLLKTEFKTIYIYSQILNSEFKDRYDYGDYFTHILYSQEKGSLYQRMKEKNYISSIRFDLVSRENDYTALMVGIDLTEDGYLNIDEVMRSYYVFVQDFKEKVSKNNFVEMKKFKNILFQYDSNEGIDEDSVSSFASLLNYIPNPEELLTQGLFKNFNKKEFVSFLEGIANPKKNIIVISSNHFDGEVKLNSQLFDSIDNEFSESNEYVQVNYQKILTLSDDQIQYLTTYDKETEKDEFNFIYKLNLELAPKEDIKIYDAMQDDVKKIQEKVDLGSLNSDELIFITPTFDSQANEYSEDPFTKSDTKSLQKFAFTEQKWVKQLSDENVDNRSTPILLQHSENLNNFIMIDIEKKQPQIFCQIKLTNKNEGILSQEQQTFQSIFLTSQFRFIEQEYSQAFESEYGFSISSSIDDIQMQVNGWDEHFGKVMKNFITTLQEYEPSQEEWEASQEVQILDIQEQISDLSLFQTISRQLIPSFIDDNFYPFSKQIELIQNSKLSDTKKYVKNMFSPTNLDILFSGNISPIKSIEYANEIKTFFDMTSLNPDRDPKNSEIKIVNLSNKSYVYQELNKNPEDRNSALLNLYQIGERTVESMVYLNILSEKMDRFFFENLRTKKGLGYVAGARIMTFGCVDYVGVILQGEKKQPNKINKIIEKSFVLLEEQINDLTEDEFQDQLASMKIQYEMLPPSLSDKFETMWKQINREKYDFDIRYYVLNALDNKITLEGYKKFFLDKFKTNASKLSVQVHSQAQKYNLKDTKIKNYATNLSETLEITSKEDIVKSNEQPYFSCSYTI